MTHATAFRRKFPQEPVHCEFRGLVMNGADIKDMVVTPDGPMMRVEIYKPTNFADPAVVPILRVGLAVHLRLNGQVSAVASAPIWSLDNKYYTTAVDGGGFEYYRNHCYLLHEITVADEDKINTHVATILAARFQSETPQ